MPNEVYAKLYEMLSNFAIQSIKCLMLINGGAAVAILAFIGNFIGQENVNINAFKLTIAILSNALLSFSCGVVLATLSSFFSYLCQLLVLETLHHKAAATTRYIAIIMALSSLLAFSIGTGYSYGAFITLSDTITINNIKQ